MALVSVCTSSVEIFRNRSSKRNHLNPLFHLRAEEPGTLSGQSEKEGRERGVRQGSSALAVHIVGPQGDHQQPPSPWGHRNQNFRGTFQKPLRTFCRQAALFTLNPHTQVTTGALVTCCLSTRSLRPQTPYHTASQTHLETQALHAPHGPIHHKLFPGNLSPLPPPPCPITSCDFIFPFGI